MTDELARAIADELPRARRRMWILLAVTLAVMAGILVGLLVLAHNMQSSHHF